MTTITRDHRITVKERLARDPEFADAMLDQLAELLAQNADLLRELTTARAAIAKAKGE